MCQKSPTVTGKGPTLMNKNNVKTDIILEIKVNDNDTNVYNISIDYGPLIIQISIHEGGTFTWTTSEWLQLYSCRVVATTPFSIYEP